MPCRNVVKYDKKKNRLDTDCTGRNCGIYDAGLGAAKTGAYFQDRTGKNGNDTVSFLNMIVLVLSRRYNRSIMINNRTKTKRGQIHDSIKAQN